MSKNKTIDKIKIDKKIINRAKMPKYNGYQCGYGVHGDTKYNRRKNKEMLRREIEGR